MGSKVDWEKLGETHLGAGVSRWSWACNHCFQYLIPGQFWQVSSTLTLVSVTWLCTCRVKHTAHFDISHFDRRIFFFFVEVGRVLGRLRFWKDTYKLSFSLSMLFSLLLTCSFAACPLFSFVCSDWEPSWHSQAILLKVELMNRWFLIPIVDLHYNTQDK